MIFTGTKIWNDFNYNKRPTDINLTVYKQADSITVPIDKNNYDIVWSNKENSNEWTYTITSKEDTDWSIYATTGSKWGYYIVESAVTGYNNNNNGTIVIKKSTSDGTKVTNEMNTLTNNLTTSFSITKQWIGDDKNKYVTRPNSVVVLLQYQNDDNNWDRVSNILTDYNDIVPINVSKDYYKCYHTFNNLAWDKTYRVVELGICDENEGSFNDDFTQYTYNNGNTYDVYEYNNQKYRILDGDGIDQNFGYTVKYLTNDTISNVLAYTDLTITKNWIDSNNLYGFRPKTITIRLQRKLAETQDDWQDVKDINGNFVEYTMTGGSYDNIWKLTIPNIPKYDIYGNKYIYIAVEQQGNTGAYKWQYDNNDTFSYWNDTDYQNATSKFNSEDNQWEVSVTNRLITGNLKVNELFNDNGNRIYDIEGNIQSSENVDAYRPENVKVSISAKYSCPTNNGYVDSNLPSTSTELIFGGNYTNLIEDLPIYDAEGNLIKYTIISAINEELSQYTINAVEDVSKITIKQNSTEVQQENSRTASNSSSNGANVKDVTLLEDVLTEITFPNVHELDTKTVSVVKNWTNYNTYKEYLPKVYGYLIASFNISTDDKTYWLVPSSDIDLENPMKDWKYLGSNETDAKTKSQEYFNDMSYKKELANDGKTINWGNLPVNAVNYQFNGETYALGESNPITYQVFEIESSNNPKQYSDSISINSDVTTITNALTTIDIPVFKYWDDDNNRDGIRPTQITINLIGSVNGEICYQDSTTITPNSTEDIPKSDITGNSDDTFKVSCWKYVFEKVPKYNKNGDIISYSVTEDSINNYKIPNGYPKDYTYNQSKGYLIVNKHEPELININITKIWNDNSNVDRPTSIIVNLLADGIISQTETLTAENQVENSNKWKYTFTDYKYNQGKEIKYTISEEQVENYRTSYNQDTFTITNTQHIDIPVKKVWKDSNNQDGMRPSKIEINLLANGEIVSTETVTSADDWTYTFKDYPKCDQNMNLIEYSVTENQVNNYTAKYSIEYDIYVITNTHNIRKLSINVDKIWIDDNNQNSRPDTITIKLYANGNETNKTLELSAEENWTGKFTNLNMYNHY